MWPISSSFKNGLSKPVRDVTMRVTAVDSTTMLPLLDITSPTVEGTVYVDVERATRRTAQIRLINTDGAFTPTGSDYTNLGTNSVFFWNKLFKIEYGLLVGSDYEWCPLGIFMVDSVEVMAEKGVSVLNINGSDRWKMLTFSTFAAPVTWAKGTALNTVISDIASAAGITQLNLANLSGRTADQNTTQIPIFFEADDNRGDKLKELCATWNLEIFFDVNGYLVTRDITDRNSDMFNQPPVWTFAGGKDSIFISITKQTSGDGIKNHIVVTGEADDGTAVVRAEAVDGVGTTDTSHYYTNSVGPLTTTQIGDRVLHIKSTVYRKTAECLDRAKTELLNNRIVSEDISLPIIVVPCFEGNDVIQIIETNSKTNDRYFLSSFDIPMQSSSTQELKVNKVRNI